MEIGIRDFDPRHPYRQIALARSAADHVLRMLSVDRHVADCEAHQAEHERAMLLQRGNKLGKELANHQRRLPEKGQDNVLSDQAKEAPLEPERTLDEDIARFLAVDPNLSYADMGLTRDDQVLIGSALGNEILEDWELAQRFELPSIRPWRIKHAFDRFASLDDSIGYQEMGFDDAQAAILQEKVWYIPSPS